MKIRRCRITAFMLSAALLLGGCGSTAASGGNSGNNSAGTEVTKELATSIQNAAVPFVWIQTEERNVKVLSNMMVDLTTYVDCNPEELGVTELVYYPALAQLMEEYEDEDELKEAIKHHIHDLIPKHITEEDIFASNN